MEKYIPSESSEQETRSRKIAELNDALRQYGIGGHIYFTSGVSVLSGEQLQIAFTKLRIFDEFSESNDSHKEYDFGILKIDEHTLYWKIDYYDKTLHYGSDDPANSDVTERVLTVMLAEEY